MSMFYVWGGSIMVKCGYCLVKMGKLRGRDLWGCPCCQGIWSRKLVNLGDKKRIVVALVEEYGSLTKWGVGV
jgi:hypothetical protein